MNDRTSCATPEALVTYVYDESEHADRASLAAHLAICASCAEEVQALRDTRAHLTSWSPPTLSLGFQITRTDSDQPANQETGRVLRPAAWYRQPLPAWAQMAAAVVIFAAGMSVSAFRSADAPPARVAASPAPPAPVVEQRPVDDLAVTRDEFVRLESRLRSIERSDVQRASLTSDAGPSSAALSTGPSNDQLVDQINALKERLTQSERQHQAWFLQIAEELNKTNRNFTQRTAVLDEGQRELDRAVRSVVRTPGLAVPVAFNGR